MKKKVALYALIVSAILLVGISMGASNPIATPSASPGGKNIMDAAIAAGNFKTLVAALQTTGLADTLKGGESFTVFAPTDEAFAKMPKDQLSALMANKTLLTALLTYHLAPGVVMSIGLNNEMQVKTVSGENLVISLANGDIMINDAKVVQPDIIATNGVIHAIDKVLIPNIVARASNLNLSKSNVNRKGADSANNTAKEIAVGDSGVSTPKPVPKPIKK
jgi:uncharacterized surface protein with fasciclin (FAS1) repeats